MNFGQALEALKDGEPITREGWNGAGQFAYLVPPASYPAQTGVAKEHFGEGAKVPYRAYMALKTAQGDVAVWQPSVSDILAEDWGLWIAPAQDVVTLDPDDAKAIRRVLDEPMVNRGQPTSHDPLIDRYDRAVAILDRAIGDRGK